MRCKKALFLKPGDATGKPKEWKAKALGHHTPVMQGDTIVLLVPDPKSADRFLTIELDGGTGKFPWG